MQIWYDDLLLHWRQNTLKRVQGPGAEFSSPLSNFEMNEAKHFKLAQRVITLKNKYHSTIPPMIKYTKGVVVIVQGLIFLHFATFH